MRRLFLFTMLLAYNHGYSAEQLNDRVQLDEFVVKGVNWLYTKLDNVHYINTSGAPLRVNVFLEGRKINLELTNENTQNVDFSLVCNGFVHPLNEPVGKATVDSEYTYTRTLGPKESYVYTIGHKSMIPIIGHGGVPGNIKDNASTAKAYLKTWNVKLTKETFRRTGSLSK